jgi:hypothetical protein
MEALKEALTVLLSRGGSASGLTASLTRDMVFWAIVEKSPPTSILLSCSRRARSCVPRSRSRSRSCLPRTTAVTSATAPVMSAVPSAIATVA